MPITIEQYPDFFNHNRWLLPLSVVIVVVCWVSPFFMHERAGYIWVRVSSLGSIGRGLALVIILAILGAGVLGTIRLLKFNVAHLNALLTKKPTEILKIQIRDHHLLVAQRKHIQPAVGVLFEQMEIGDVVLPAVRMQVSERDLRNACGRVSTTHARVYGARKHAVRMHRQE